MQLLDFIIFCLTNSNNLTFYLVKYIYFYYFFLFIFNFFIIIFIIFTKLSEYKLVLNNLLYNILFKIFLYLTINQLFDN